MKVSAIMTPRPVTVSPDATLDEAIRMMDENRVRHLPVLEGNRLAGVVSDRDLLEATGWLPARVRDVFDEESRKRKIEDIMKGPAVTVDQDATVISACLDMLGRSIGCLPVVKGTELVGMISEMDVLAVFIRHCGGGRFDPPVEGRMTREVTGVNDDATLEHAADLMLSLGVRHLPVLQNGALLGMLSDRDLQRGIGSGRNPDSLVEEVMSKSVVSVRTSDPVSRAAELMTKHRISAIPVVEDGLLEGMISMSDVLDICLDGLREPEELKS